MSYVTVADQNLQTLSAYTVTTTAGAIVTAPQTIKAKQYVRIQAPSTNTASVFYGDSTVTTSNGLEIVPGAYFDVHVRDAVKLFAIVAAGTQNLRIAAV